jgi:MFS family permease
MGRREALPKIKSKPLGREFSIFWFGQAITVLGTAFTQYGLPLLVFRLTGSALNLAFGQISIYLPYVLFGLFIGAWTDRLDRKKLLVRVNLLRGLLIALIPLLAVFQGLNVYWIYIIAFLNSVLAVFSSAATSTVVPSLVEKDQLVAANSRISVTDSMAKVAGPVLAGVLVTIAPLETIFLVDSLSFFVIASSLLLIKSSFNPARPAGNATEKNVFREIKEGLVFLRQQTVVLNAALLATVTNLLMITAATQQITLVKRQFQATDQQVSFMFAAGGIGAVIFSFLVNRLPKRWGFGRIAIGSQVITGILVLLLGSVPIFELAPLLVIFIAGCGIIFNIQFNSLVQFLVPNQLLGRVSSTITVLAFVAIPVGSLAGGSLIEWSGNVGLVYQAIGILVILLAGAFIFTPLSQPQNTALPASKEAIKVSDS